MRSWGVFLCTLAAVLLLSATAGAADTSKLDVYTASVDSAKAAELARAGYDFVSEQATFSGTNLELIVSAKQAAKLRAQGVDLKLKRDKKGHTIQQRAALQAADGFTVWRSYDEPAGLRDEMYALAKKHPSMLKLVVLGRTWQGREIIALKLTQGARGQRDGSRPAALYMSTQHAREWISPEVNRRFLLWLLEQQKTTEIKNLLKATELWFVFVANPDGYQYTFDVERLWRKNLRDNDGDQQITNNDGVDPNRNYPSHWNYDNEGSSGQFSSETYRGPTAGSEPETQAIMSLASRINAKFVVNWHSVGSWILYAPGWQMGTVSADNGIYQALAGTDEKPGIPGFDPGPSADELYVTNGETTDWFAESERALGFTPELSDAGSDGGFVFPDDPVLVQQEADNARPFALDVAKSIRTPATPASHLGNTTKPFYLEFVSGDPEATLAATGDLRFDVSYGDPQKVRVVAKRRLGAVSLKYQINGGAVQTGTTSEWAGGERYGQEGSVYYRIVEGTVTGTTPGDSVKVWFTGGGATSESFTYQRDAAGTGADVLVLAAEDYTGQSPPPAPAPPAGGSPAYLSYYTDALTANAVTHDVYDVDARGRKAPDLLGVLSHYEAVVWYTGDDNITREPGHTGGNVSRLANDENLEVRSFLNEGGRLLYTGKWAGHQGTTNHGAQWFDSIANRQCIVGGGDPLYPSCNVLAGSGDLQNDFLQYWLGAYILNEDAGFNEATDNLYDVVASGTPFDSPTALSWGFNDPDSAENQDHSASFITTAGILGAGYPQFDSWAAAKYDRPGGPFAPHTGEKYMYSQIGDVAYKRLTRSIDVPATGGAKLSFWTSYNTEHDWDFLFVEAHTLDDTPDDDWTTLQDENGHNSQSTGPNDPDLASCPAGWHDIHPHLAHYQTWDGVGACTPTGSSSGVWWAQSGNSPGWEQWEVDLSAYAGTTVEVSIAYASDWAVQGLGVFVDDIEVTYAGTAGPGTTSFEDDTDPMDGWAVTGPPPGNAPNPNNFVRIDAAGFPEGAVVATDDTLYMGFGFEGISGTDTRAEVMDRALDYLLRP